MDVERIKRSFEELRKKRAEMGLPEAVKPEYQCEACHDTGWITVRREGLQPESVPCKCYSQRAFDRSVKNSGIDPELLARCTLDSFKTLDENARRMKETALAFLADEQARGMGCFGRSGTGKTHICIAVCAELARRGRSVKYMQYSPVMRKLLANKYDAEGYEEVMEPLAGCPILYIDDLFKNAADARTAHLANDEKRIMFELLDRRYKNNAVTIVSTEMSLQDIRKEDEAIASRIYQLVGKYGCRCDGANRRFGSAEISQQKDDG